MAKKRNHRPPALSFQERLARFAQSARAAAGRLPAGEERQDLLLKARESDAAAKIDRWLSSPGLQSPK